MQSRTEASPLLEQGRLNQKQTFDHALNVLQQAHNAEAPFKYGMCASLLCSVLLAGGVTGIAWYLIGSQTVPLVLGSVSCVSSCVGLQGLTLFAQRRVEKQREAAHEALYRVAMGKGSINNV